MVSSETSLSGKLFVELVALIYLSYIKKQMQDNNLFKDYTMQQVLDKLDVIECFENPTQVAPRYKDSAAVHSPGVNILFKDSISSQGEETSMLS